MYNNNSVFKLTYLLVRIIIHYMTVVSEIELINKARAGDELALEKLFINYKNLAIKITRRYFLAGQDSDDLYQEAMIGLFKAYQSFDSEIKSDFKSFASLCINRQIQSAIKSANRQKNRPLNEAISLNNQGGYDFIMNASEDDDILFFIIPSTEQLPDAKLISKEEIARIKTEIINNLSNFERQVLTLYLKGLSYKDMAKKLDKNTKSIENSLTRIKNKLSFLKKEIS